MIVGNSVELAEAVWGTASGLLIGVRLKVSLAAGGRGRPIDPKELEIPMLTGSLLEVEGWADDSGTAVIGIVAVMKFVCVMRLVRVVVRRPVLVEVVRSPVPK